MGAAWRPSFFRTARRGKPILKAGLIIPAVMSNERRRTQRVEFTKGHAGRIIGIDGTWFRECIIDDVSATGARLSVEGQIENLNLEEFFLVLSGNGHPHRRCQKVWLNGEELGVRFLQDAPRPRARSRPQAST
jgi:hypothetical protein